jgi:hypothetical protein
VNERQRGRPVLGAVAGFFFGIFVSLDLVVFGVLPLQADVLAFMPLLGAAAGLLLGLKAPFGRRKHMTAPEGEPAAEAA